MGRSQRRAHRDVDNVTALLVGRLGTIPLAATNISFNINMLAFMPMMGFGMAVMILVGQYQGKQRPDLSEKSVYSGMHLTYVYMVGIAAAYFLIPEFFLWPFEVKADPISFLAIKETSIILLRFIAVYSSGFEIWQPLIELVFRYVIIPKE